MITAPTTATAAVSAATASDPVSEGSKSEEDYALEQAAATGQPYELVSARTESTDTWAQSDGSWSVKRYGTPVRLLRDGAWIPTDANLVFTGDGSVVPKASTVDVTFSGGGTEPLLTGVKDGRTLSLTWPKALPKPTLEENVATYAEVLPGVDLQLKAEIEGFSQLLVVKTAEAAANPELASLKYKLETIGLDVSTDTDTGSVTAVNPAGQTVFTSPSPLMWDSSTISSDAASAARSTFTATEGEAEDGAPADLFDPPPGAQEAQMPTTVTGDTLEIKPDQELLTGENTTYPVYIDPSWAWGEKQNWTRVYKAYPNSSFWNTKDPVRVGYEAETGGSDRISRSFVQLDTSDTKYAQVKSSVFRIRNTWSWSCQDRPVELWHTTGITKKTTWNNQPAKKATEPMDTVDDSKGWSQDCAAGNLEFDATSVVRDAASKGWSSVTFGLYASNEADTFGWKKFDAKTAVLETKYNNPPKKPTGLGTNPRSDCKTGGLIGNTRVSLYATFDDKDAGNLTAEFQIFKAGTTTPSATMSLPATKGKVTTWVIPDADLPTGDWSWKVRAKDQDNAYSPWPATCKFTIDRTRPSKPPVITSSDGKFPPGDNGWPSVTGKARDTGTFAFGSNGVTDVVHYVWWTDHDPNFSYVDPGIAVSVRPPGYGPHFLYAYSVDKAGNRSDTATYLYYAGRSQERDGPTDLNGDGNSDIWSIDSNGTLLTYAGQGNGDFAAATNGGKAFSGASIASRGGWRQVAYNDLVALEFDDVEKRKRLWAYPNNGHGAISDDFIELTVSCPLPNEDLGCIGDETWTGDDHWHNAEQIVAPGDLNGDTQPDLLVKQGKFLWVYYGNRAAYSLDVREPVLVGGGDWDKFTVIAPGDLNGDTIADLWLRDDATGDIWSSYGTKGVNGYLDPTTWGNAAGRVKIGSGYQAAVYPAVGSVGDVTGDSLADLWTRKADNTMSGWPGKVTNGQLTGFGTAFSIDGITGGIRLAPGTQLTSGQSITSNSATLTMKGDGNLTVTSKAGTVVWQSKTSGNPDATARVEANGNLTVYSSDGLTKLWTTGLSSTTTPNLTGEGYVLLQDKGNLVVYNAKSQALWSNGSGPRHDYNGDGRSDLAWWNDFAAGTDAIYSLLTNSDGTFKEPLKSYAAAVGVYEAKYMKFVTGDFNGDGRGDVAALHPKTDTSLEMLTFLGQANGGFAAPFASWKIGPNAMHGSYMTPQAGDFNGDGRDDVAIWYAYPDGTTKLFTLTANIRGGFNTPFDSWSAPAGTWLRSRCKFTTGDFNGDGRDDITVFYGQGDDTIRTHTFLASVTGGFSAPTSWWYTGSLDWDQATPQAGDFSGDGRDDIMIWYAYNDGSDKVSTMFAESLSGKDQFGSAKVTLDGKFSWDINQTQLATGDFNGDGYDDLAALRQQNGTVQTWTWNWSGPDATFKGGLAGWSAQSSGWPYEAIKIVKPYN